MKDEEVESKKRLKDEVGIVYSGKGSWYILETFLAIQKD